MYEYTMTSSYQINVKHMNKQKIATILLVAVSLLCTLSVLAAPKPRWVQKGVASLNRERSNDSYRFLRFSTSDIDPNRLVVNRFQPLLTYVSELYQVSLSTVQLDSLVSARAARTTYRISFPSPEGGTSELFAQLVDDWSQFDDGIVAYMFQREQLYVLSELNAVPDFDDFELTRNYGAKPALMSLIPGLGQIYKGQAGKGYAIMGIEAMLLSGAIYSAVEARRYNRLAHRYPEAYASYWSDAATFRQLRNVCLFAAGGLYLYNLIDAVAAKGARRVVIKPQHHTELALMPVVLPYGTGIGMQIRF